MLEDQSADLEFMQRVEKGDRSEWSGALISDSPLFGSLPQQLHEVPF